MKMEKIFDIKGNVALVTGAASGIGLAITEAMAENGAHVVMVDLNADNLKQHSERLKKAGASVETAVVDVSDFDKLRQVIDDAATRNKRLDTVFANAGMSAGPGFIMTPKGELEAVSVQFWEQVMKVNLTSVLVTMQAAAAHMKRQRNGRIVVTSSSAGLKAEPLVGYGYVSAKAALCNLVRQAAVELGPHNVVVNAICPAAFITNLAGGIMSRDPAARDKMEHRTVLNRLAVTDEIKGLALLLGSPASSFITGAMMSIDGGLTAV